MIRGRRRQVLIALSLGCFLSFGLNFWFVAVATPENFEDYMWLANVNEPGAYEAERIFRNLYLRFGERWSYRAAILGGYGVLVLMWTVVCFITLFIARLTGSGRNQVGSLAARGAVSRAPVPLRLLPSFLTVQAQFRLAPESPTN